MTTPSNAVIVAPAQESNQLDAVGRNTANTVARGILDAHKAGLLARRERDLISEKLLLHIDGSGDLQWADIINGTRVDIPRAISEYRRSENLLRLVVDNAVAHHTTMPLQYFAESTPDRDARQKAMLDALVMNHVAKDQNLTGLFTEALYVAMPCGFCPTHAYWRDDPSLTFEPVAPTDMEDPANADMRMIQPVPGSIECWLGNPFDTVFNRGAKRHSILWGSYGRVLPAHLVRSAFGHIPGVAGMEGTMKLPAASLFQRIARNWRMEGIGLHGTPIMSHRRNDEDGEELMVLICKEYAPGATQEWPEGRLQIVAVPGASDLREGEGQSQHAILLADQPLPGGVFSFTNFYSHHRHDDVHGKPWVEDLDELQIELNLALSKRWETINKMVEAPVVTPGGAIADDMSNIGGYNMLEIEPTLTSWRPRVMEYPSEILVAIDREIEDKRRAIYTGGGFQAASRGEAPGSRMPYRAIVALQQADSSIHGPVHVRYLESAAQFAQTIWRQFKAYGDVPWMLKVTGDEFSYMAKPYVNRTMLSDTPPQYKLVNSFGPSPEMRAQEVLELMRTVGADGEPFLSTREARRQYPNRTIFDPESDLKSVAKRRARTIAEAIHTMATEFREQFQFTGIDMADPVMQQAAFEVFRRVEQRYPRMRDDNLDAHLSSYSEITQDETADPLARLVAQMRQELYYIWQAQMNAQMMPLQLPGVGAGGAVPQQRLGGRSVAAEMGGATSTSGATLGNETPAPALTAR